MIPPKRKFVVYRVLFYIENFWFYLVKRHIERSKKLIQELNVEIEELQSILKILSHLNYVK